MILSPYYHSLTCHPKRIVTAVVAFVRWQLQRESQAMDRMFAQYQNPQSEAARHKVFAESGFGDPRLSLYNVLSWKGVPKRD